MASPFDWTEIVCCIDDIRSITPGYVKCGNALKKLEGSICPELGGGGILLLLKGNGDIPPLDGVLLDIVSSDSHPEICRERASNCLKSMVHMIFLENQEKDPMTDAVCYAWKFFEAFCSIFQKRFEFQGGRCKPTEVREEIRLLLVEIMCKTVKFMSLTKDMRPEEGDTKAISSAVSLLCQSLYKSALLDSFPDLKRASCALLRSVCPISPSVIRMHSQSLLSPIIGNSISQPNDQGGETLHAQLSLDNMASSLLVGTSKNCLLRHRHSKTRILAIETVLDILFCYKADNLTSPEFELDTDSKMVLRLTSQVLPNLELFGPYDKSASVRTALVRTVSSLLSLCRNSDGVCHAVELMNKNVPDATRVLQRETILVISRLLVLHLLCMSDEHDTVSKIASDLWDNPTPVINHDCNRACLMTSDLAILFRSEVIDLLLINITCGKSLEQKKRYLDALSLTITNLTKCDKSMTYMNGTVLAESQARKITRVLYTSFLTDDNSCFRSTMRCATAIGGSIQFRQSILRFIFNIISEESDEQEVDDKNDIEEAVTIRLSTSKCACALSFMSGILKGTRLSSRGMGWSELHEVTSTMTNQKVIVHIHSSSRTAYALLDLLIGVKEIIADQLTTSESDMIGPIITNTLFGCVNLLGCEADIGLGHGSMEIITSLSIHGDKDKDLVTNLLDVYFNGVLDLVTSTFNWSETKCWAYGDPGLLAFNSLLRNCHGKSVGKNFDCIGPVIEAHLADERCSSEESEILFFRRKIFCMALLEYVVSNPAISRRHLNPFVERLIRNCIIPNLIWRSGAIASSLRKVSMAVLYGLITPATAGAIIYECAPVMFPVLKSSLGDDDGSIRELAITTLGNVFETVPGVLGKEAVRQLCPDLLNCLDDSVENIRLASCNALKQFLRCSPAQNYHGGIIEDMVETLFIHMDDTNADLQESIYDVLVVASTIDNETVVKNAERCLSCHTSQRYCKMLLGN